jgi:hypothetical protein
MAASFSEESRVSRTPFNASVRAADEFPKRMDRFLDDGVRTEFCSKGRGLSRRQAGELGPSVRRRFLPGSNVLSQSHYGKIVENLKLETPVFNTFPA